MARHLIYEISDSNMAGYEWAWRFHLNRTADGCFTVSVTFDGEDPRPEVPPAYRGLMTGAQVYGALMGLLEATPYSGPLVETQVKQIADDILAVDATLSAEFTAAAAAAEVAGSWAA